MDKDKRNTLIVLGIIVICTIVVLFLENGSRVLLDEQYDKLDGIVINSDLADIEVEYIGSRDINILIYGKRKDSFNYYVEDNILFINKESSRGFCLLNCKDKILLYLPQEFSYLDITSEMGNIDTGKKVLYDKLIINSSIGNIEIGSVKEVDIKTDIANVNIKEINAVADSNIITNSGDVVVKKTSDLDIDASSNTGKEDIKNTKDNTYTLTIKTETGNIKVG